MPPVDYLEECFSLDHKAGVLTWKKRPLSHFKGTHGRNNFNAQFAGKPAGSLRKDGYLYVLAYKRKCLLHRIVWKMVTGCEPTEQIDHINGVRGDNRFCNLREASMSENRRNSPVYRNNLLQTKGVRELQNGRFRVRIVEDKKLKDIGYFDTLEEAKAAFDKAAKELHGEFFHP
jgi:hypothetical protein